jgi:hypothetical protein
VTFGSSDAEIGRAAGSFPRRSKLFDKSFVMPKMRLKMRLKET